MIDWFTYQKSSSDILSRQRLMRLKSTDCILGQPDLISLSKTIITSSFLSQKKIVERTELFAFGLNFPTTAHFSSFANQLLKKQKKQKGEVQYKVKLHTFDIYQGIDIQIQISIPGSLEIKGYNLTGQPVNIGGKDYQRGYYSSFLRSLFPFNSLPFIKRFDEIENYSVLKKFIESFIPFSVDENVELSQTYAEHDQFNNLGIEMIINYTLQNRLWNLCQILIQKLTKYFPQRSLILKLEVWERKKQYKNILRQTASKLIKIENLNPYVSQSLKQYQLNALYKENKQYQTKALGEYLLHEGLPNIKGWKALLNCYYDDKKDKTFLKLMNTAMNFINQQNSIKIQDFLEIPKLKLFINESKVPTSKKISDFPEYCLVFNHEYLASDPKVIQYKEILQKAGKEKTTFDLMQKIDNALKESLPLYDILINFEKHKSWNHLIKIRSECFWLENDFVSYQKALKQNFKSTEEKSFRFLNESMTQLQKDEEKYEVKEEEEDENDEIEGVNQSFQGDFSDAEDSQNKSIPQMPLCSKRMAVTKRFQHEKNFTKPNENKILCHYALEKNFVSIYQNIKLQLQLQKWASKININKIEEFPYHKRELLAIILLKKAFLHQKMQRLRKCEETFKLARKVSSSALVGVVSCYSLAILYKQNNNFKGVEFYMVELVRVLWAAGVREYDVIPDWGKETIPFIVEQHGKSILKKLEGPLKQIIQKWIYLTQERK